MERPLSSMLAAEAYGTFLLSLLGPMSVTIVMNPNIFPAGVPLGIGFIGLAHGAALLAGIATVARISGAHFNPAVTIALAYSGRFPRNRVIPYILAQLVGAAIAGFTQLAIVGVAAAQASDLKYGPEPIVAIADLLGSPRGDRGDADLGHHRSGLLR